MPTPLRKKVPLRATGVSCLLAALVLASPALGADSATEQARQHYEIGTQQYDLGHWDDAIREFEKAYELRPDPSFLYNLAQAYRRKGDNKRALDLYKNYLVKVPKTPQRTEIEERISGLQKQIDEAASAKPGAPTLEPTAISAGTPASPEVAPAQAEESAISPPPVSPAPEATTATGPTSSPAAPPSQTPPAAVAATSAPAPVVAKAVAPAPRGRGLRIAGIVCGSVGVASIVLGALSGWQAQSLSHKVATADQFHANDDSAGLAAQKAQGFFYVAGAVVAVVGGALYYYGVRAARETPSRVSLSPIVGPGTAGLAAMGVF
ncbi:MAG: tetratricopeptide repeat protein [Polyangia bacterium]